MHFPNYHTLLDYQFTHPYEECKKIIPWTGKNRLRRDSWLVDWWWLPGGWRSQTAKSVKLHNGSAVSSMKLADR